MNPFLRVTLIGCAMLVLVSCGEKKADSREFTVRGIVRGISPDRTTLDVHHEEIPNYMPEMTMPFALKDPRGANVLKAGDAISFRLVVDDKEAAIDRIMKIPSDQVRVTPATAAPQSNAPVVARLKSGDALPPFQLTNERGETITTDSFRGQPLVLTFIFTRCPVPNYCPLMSRNFAQLQDAIRNAADQSLGKTRLLSISFDPEHDTPDVLKDYAASERAEPALWSFATGARPQIDALTKRFAVMVQPEAGTISHGLATALIDPNGRIVEIWRGNSWKPEEVLEKIRAL